MQPLYNRCAARRLWLARAGGAGLAILALGGCAQISMVMPMSFGGAEAEAPTQAVDAVATALPPVPALPERPVSEQISDPDWRVAKVALVSALAQPQGRSVPWINPETGVMGTVALADQGASPCRPFDLTVFDKDRADRLKGEACRDVEGNWDMSALRPFRSAAAAGG